MSDRVKRVSVAILMLVALVVYALSLSSDYSPGASATSVAQALRLTSFPTYGHPIWHGFVWLIGQLPGSTAFNLNVASTIVGLCSVWFMFHLAWLMPHGVMSEDRFAPTSEPELRLIGALVSTVAFAFSVPVWTGGTRPYPQVFGLCLLLALSWFTVRTFQLRSPRRLLIASVAWGLLLAEYPTSWVYLPLFIVAVLVTGFSEYGAFRWKRNLKVLAAMVLGYLLSLVTAIQVATHPAADVIGLTNFLDAYWAVLRYQKILLLEALPWQGGLGIAILVGGPFFAIFMPKSGTSLQHRFATHFLHGVCTAVVVIMFLHPPMSPWGVLMSGQTDQLMIAPYALMALTIGYLASYWVVAFDKEDQFQPVAVQAVRKGLRYAYRPVLLLALLLLTFWNLNQRESVYARFANQRCQEMATRLADTKAFVGETGFNHVLKLTLRDQESPAWVLDVQPGAWMLNNFRLLVAQRFLETPRLASLVDVGLAPLLRGWIQSSGEQAKEEILIGNFPDLIYQSGFVPVPDFYGDRAATGLSVSNLLAHANELQTAWARMDTNLLHHAEHMKISARAKGVIGIQFMEESRRANNMGYLLERKEHREQAVDCYRAALRLYPENISALLNLTEHIALLPKGEQDQIHGKLKALFDDLGDRRFQQWRLSQTFGYIANPRAHLDRGLSFVVTGKPGLAVRELTEALEQVPDSPLVRLRLAHAQMVNQDLDAAEKQYIGLLEENPNNAAALLGMTRIYAMRSMPEQAESYVQRYAELGGDEKTVHQERIAILTMSGNYREALGRQKEWLKEHRGDTAARIIAAELALRIGDRKSADEQMQKLLLADKFSYAERAAFGDMLMTMGEFNRAERAYHASLQARPGYLGAITGLMRHALATSDLEKQRTYAYAALKHRPEDPMANLVLGVVLLEERKLDEAIEAFRTSLEEARSADALNALAYALLLDGDPEEGLPLSEEALELNQNSASYWDTHAMIHFELGNLGKAKKTQETAMSLDSDDPELLLHYAMILDRLGDEVAANAAIEQLRRNEGLLPTRVRLDLTDFLTKRKS